MDILYTTILDLLNGLIPSSIHEGQYTELNELLAYVITVGFVYLMLLNPLVNFFKRITGGTKWVKDYKD